MNVKNKVVVATKIIYWLLVAAIPAIVWVGDQEYAAIMKLYRPREEHIIANDLEIYWRMFLFYTAVVLWPLCLLRIVNSIRNMKS